MRPLSRSDVSSRTHGARRLSILCGQPLGEPSPIGLLALCMAPSGMGIASSGICPASHHTQCIFGLRTSPTNIAKPLQTCARHFVRQVSHLYLHTLFVSHFGIHRYLFHDRAGGLARNIQTRSLCYLEFAFAFCVGSHSITDCWSVFKDRWSVCKEEIARTQKTYQYEAGRTPQSIVGLPAGTSRFGWP